MSAFQARYAGGMVTQREHRPRGAPSQAKPANEKELVASIRTRADRLNTAIGRRSIVTLGIGDDCAVLRPRKGRELVVTTDLTLETVHFRRDWHPPRSVGHRCLARGLSDLAAMGARPEAAFLSLAVPADLTGTWVDGFFDGLMALAERYQVPLAGGDTAKSPVTPQTRRGQTGGLVVADILLLGSVPAGKALLRSGARAGDILYVTGTLGGSAAELLALEQKPRAFAGAGPDGHPHLYPEPRVGTGRKLLQQRLATAAIDLSDGLSTDLAHLCEESGLAAEIDAEAIPVHPHASLQHALHGGEDYELLFTASSKATLPRRIGGVEVHAIGRMKKRGKGPQVELLQGVIKNPLISGGWDHFR